MLAKRIRKSRRWVYYIYDKPNVSIDVVIEIGKIIHYDFSKEIKLYSSPISTGTNAHEGLSFSSTFEEAQYWKEMYYSLLEKYNVLLEDNRK